jgi:metallo-beta-lactamase family protein
MKLSFHGAARTVTGSKHILHLNNGKKILLDCGMFQGMGMDTDAFNSDFGFDPTAITYMILSHAHIDHSGLIPKLIKDGYGGKIYATPATIQLANLLLEDSAAIQESDVKYSNRSRVQKGLPMLKPLYTKEEAKAAAAHFEPVEYDTWFTIEKGIEFCFKDAGHIIGSATVHLRITEEGKTRQISFSGDVGRYRDMILKSPSEFSQADYIILESTYGNRLHEDLESSVDTFLKHLVHTCLEKKGKLIIPAFSVGRTQEILFTLNQLELEDRLPPLDYFVDSPLSRNATRVVKSFPNYFNNRIQKILLKDKDPFQFERLKFVETVEESKMLNYYDGPCVIISASGMAEAGRVKHHINNNIENSRNTILFTGYCEPHSLGGRLKRGEKEVGIFGQRRQVHADIAEIASLSAHGDYEDLCQFLACQSPNLVRQLFLVHGEYSVQLDFRDRLIRKGFKHVEIPMRHTVHPLTD